TVMLRSLTKLSKCFLYIFVLRNHSSNLLEPLTKQNEAKRRKGVVGSTGRKIPRTPRPRLINPTSTNKTLAICFIELNPLLKIIISINKRDVPLFLTTSLLFYYYISNHFM